MKLTNQQVQNIGNKLGINFKLYPLSEFKNGMQVELEHGIKCGSICNVTDNNLLKTGKIALAHILEYPDYYKRLEKLENQASKYWKNKSKPNFILD